MTNVLKQLFSFILPVIVLILVPLDIEPDISVHHIAVFLEGFLIISLGLYIMILTISKFIIIGKGTFELTMQTKIQSWLLNISKFKTT
jgi:hypothetical protein